MYHIDPVLTYELLKVVNSLKNTTSPGVDGIGNGLFKKSATRKVYIFYVT